MTQVHASKLALEQRKNRPLVFCVDIGAPKSVVGRQEFEGIFRRHGLPIPRLLPSYTRFRFADTTFKSLGNLAIPLATPPGIKPLRVLLDVVEADVPALLGLDFLEK